MSRKSDYDMFISKYKPKMLDRNNIKQFEYNDLPKDMDCKYLWTVVECDNNKWYILNGYHLVNRMFYIICKNPHNYIERDYLYCSN